MLYLFRRPLLGFLLCAPVAHFFVLIVALQLRYEIGGRRAPATIDAAHLSPFTDGGRHVTVEGVTWSCGYEYVFDRYVYTMGQSSRGDRIVFRRTLDSAIACESLSAAPRAGVVSYANPVAARMLRGERVGLLLVPDLTTTQLDAATETNTDFDWEWVLRWTVLSLSGMISMALIARRRPHHGIGAGLAHASR